MCSLGAKLPEPQPSSCGHSCSEPECGKTESVRLCFCIEPMVELSILNVCSAVKLIIAFCDCVAFDSVLSFFKFYLCCYGSQTMNLPVLSHVHSCQPQFFTVVIRVLWGRGLKFSPTTARLTLPPNPDPPLPV